MESLTRLKQNGSIEEYKYNFEAMSNMLRVLSNVYNLSCFFSGFKDDIRLFVRIFNLKNFLTAFKPSQNLGRTFRG